MSARCGRIRLRRSESTNTTEVSESVSPYCSSEPVHQAFSGTAIAPAEAIAQKAIDHSGRLRIAMETRSPLRTPKRCSRAREIDATIR